jgi:hypothetical protein
MKSKNKTNKYLFFFIVSLVGLFFSLGLLGLLFFVIVSIIKLDLHILYILTGTNNLIYTIFLLIFVSLPAIIYNIGYYFNPKWIWYSFVVYFVFGTVNALIGIISTTYRINIVFLVIYGILAYYFIKHKHEFWLSKKEFRKLLDFRSVFNIQKATTKKH